MDKLKSYGGNNMRSDKVYLHMYEGVRDLWTSTKTCIERTSLTCCPWCLSMCVMMTGGQLRLCFFIITDEVTLLSSISVVETLLFLIVVLLFASCSCG